MQTSPQLLSVRPGGASGAARRAGFRFARWLTWAIAGWLLPTAAAQVLVGDVTSIGFRSSGDEQFAIRMGQWFPVQLQLNVQGSEIFTGTAQLECRDLDGDFVEWTSTSFNLSPTAPNQRLWVYAVASDARDISPSVEILNRSGGRVAKLPLPSFSVVPDRTLWLLDISTVKVARLGGLTDASDDFGVKRHYRPIKLSHGTPEELPDRWLGLEALDVIIWDRPEPARLRPNQMEALSEWVRNGGQLLLGVAEKWPELRASRLAEILPLAGDGPAFTVTRLDSLAHLLPAPPSGEPRTGALRAPLSVTSARLAPGAYATLRDVGPAGPLNLIAMRAVGAGRVVTCAASLNELSGNAFNSEALFQQFLDINRHTEKYIEASGSIGFGGFSDHYGLFDDLIQPIKFSEQTVIRGLAVLLFVGAYIGLGAFGSWWYLQRQQRTHLSWTAFAAIAVTASFLSLATVAGLRGLSRGVGACGLLHAEAGSRQSGGYCFFGYRSPIRQTVDLELADSGGFLRPLTRGSPFMEAYVTPLRFWGEAVAGRLRDTPMRATLKQFEGYWQGELDGSIRADLTLVQQTGRLTPESWILNDLSTAIEGGYLLYIDPRHIRNSAARNRSLTRAAGSERSWNQNDPRTLPPARQVICLPLTRIEKAGGRVEQPGAKVYEVLDQRLAAWERQTRPAAVSRPDLPTLWSEQQFWAGNQSLAEMAFTALTLSGQPRELNALLLASTWSLYLPTAGGNPDAPARQLSVRGIPRSDICHWLFGGIDAAGEPQTLGVLLLWTSRPPPARLKVAGAAVRSQGGWTLLRVRVPIRLMSDPLTGGEYLGDPPDTNN